MSDAVFIEPQRIQVNRSELRKQQSKYLRKATGNMIVYVAGRDKEEEGQYVVGQQYLDEMIANMRSLVETLNVMKDQKLFAQIMNVSGTIDEDIRLGKLHSFEEVFGEE